MPITPHLIFATIAQNSVESLYNEHAGSRPWIYQLFLAGTIGAIIALPLIKVDVTVSAQGIVRPATERAELRVPVTGQIAEVMAHDNDQVMAGQPLLTIRSRDLDELIALNRTRQCDKSALIDDLLLLTEEPAPTIEKITETNSSVPHEYHRAPLLHHERESTTETHLTLKAGLKTNEIRADFGQEKAQLSAVNLNVTKADRELARAKNLAIKGLITDREFDQARDDQASAVAERATFLVTTRTRREARLHEELTNLDTLRTEENRLAEELAQNTIRAPVTGAVQGLAGLFPGTWLAAGQSIGTVSPKDKLLVEALVSPRDVGLLQQEQPVRLQIDAFPYTQWGLLDGTVTAIAEDSRPPSPSDTSGSFKVVIHTNELSLRLPNGAKGSLRKGMTLTARFVIARRTLLQILYEDVSMWLNPQGNHRQS